MLRVLVACEYSGRVRDAFTKMGHFAMSCDLLTSDAPGLHYQGDVFDIIDQGWDLMIAHPPCTYLAVSGARWFYHPEDSGKPIEARRPHPKYPNRAKDRELAIKFFKDLFNSPIDKIAIENPIGTINTRFRAPDQIVHPYMFGDSASKSTCLWLKGLPLLKPTNIVDKGERISFKSGKSQPKWYSDAFVKAKTAEERRTLRSKTFQGMAKAMALQWTQTEE